MTFFSLNSFSIFLSNINIVCNDERTRTFICLAIDPNVHSSPVTLRQLTQQVDRCLDAFKLPPFYEASFIRTEFTSVGGNTITIRLYFLYSECDVSCERLVVSGQSQNRTGKYYRTTASDIGRRSGQR